MVAATAQLVAVSIRKIQSINAPRGKTQNLGGKSFRRPNPAAAKRQKPQIVWKKRLLEVTLGGVDRIPRAKFLACQRIPRPSRQHN